MIPLLDLPLVTNLVAKIVDLPPGSSFYDINDFVRATGEICSDARLDLPPATN